MTKYVYDFSEGNRDLKDLLGGKGANLAEMTRMGLPVPPGFTITTDACREFLRAGAPPDKLFTEVEEHLRLVQERLGKRLGGDVACQQGHRREPARVRQGGQRGGERDPGGQPDRGVDRA